MASNRVKLVFFLFLVLISGGYVQASTLTNFGFETGELSGWDIKNGSPSVVESYSGANGTYSAVHGDYFVQLGSGSATVTQTFNIGAGDTISGSAAFDANGPYWSKNNDGASVQIVNSSGTSGWMPWYMDNATMWVQIGNNLQTPWQEWSWTAPFSGEYTLQYKFSDIHEQGSVAIFDAVQLPDPAPEPATMLFFGFGLLSIAGISRKK